MTSENVEKTKADANATVTIDMDKAQASFMKEREEKRRGKLKRWSIADKRK